ncbi:hypothetical protein EDE08_10533 [Bradyrhizobium sp. R2.2-H]|nr:hypothetical protein EDE10_10533 [Bradyrhizobium sp. Y-H1]TCU74296.1 hypothetical protein EDE08_10533 [Bradyrhizobium sp. R2.2-H]
MNEAWQAANELIRHVSDQTIALAQKNFARMDSVGQQRMAQLHGARPRQRGSAELASLEGSILSHLLSADDRT